MASVSESTIQTISVTLKSDDVRNAIIDAARKEVQASHYNIDIDSRWTPQIVEDNYGGYDVYFRKAELKYAAKAA